MKKVGIITFHFVNNFGGALQAYALRRVIEEKGIADAEIIDYRNWFICLTDWIRLFPISTNMKEIKSGLQSLKQRFSRKRRFCSFTKDNNKMTRKYYSFRQLKANLPKDDKYICGSDQIWNPVITMGVSPCYFLEFEREKNNKIAYAPSFGGANIPKIYLKKITNYVNSIGHLSVREKSGSELIKNMTGINVPQLIDPTFLLEKQDWEGVAQNPLDSKEPYILLYIMQRDIDVYKYVKKIKEQLGLRIVEISRYGYQPGFIDEVLVDVGPAEFLGLFRDAAYICTNSYHGLVYSLIFEKRFCLVPCQHFRARIDSLIEMLHININTDLSDVKTLTASYDKEYIHNVVQEERKKAIQFLQESVET